MRGDGTLLLLHDFCARIKLTSSKFFNMRGWVELNKLGGYCKVHTEKKKGATRSFAGLID